MAEIKSTEASVAMAVLDELVYVAQTPETYAEILFEEVEAVHRDRLSVGKGSDPISRTSQINGYPTLRRSGRLARSLGWGGAGRTGESIRELRKNKLVHGTMVPYASILAKGGVLEAPPGKFFYFPMGEDWVQTDQVEIPPFKFVGLWDVIERARVAAQLVRVAVERLMGKAASIGLSSITTRKTGKALIKTPLKLRGRR